MAKLPELPYADSITRSVQKAFGGYRHTEGDYDGTLYDMKNLSSRHYPLLSVREKRKTIKCLTKNNGVFALDNELFYADGTSLFRNGKQVGTVEDSPKIFAVLGHRLVIFPDKIYLNFSALDYYDSIDALKTAVTKASYGDVYAVGSEIPRDLYYWNGREWTFLEQEFGSLEATLRGKVTFLAKSTLYGEEAEQNALTVDGADLCQWFSVGDAVTISGCEKYPQNNVTAVIREINGDTMRFYDYTFDGVLEDTAEQDVTISRTVPDMDHLCSANNRLWGCKGDTIYGSKLGDPFNFSVFDGISSDSYTVESGSAGEFTACFAYLGFPLFFKEKQIFKLYGNRPADFSLVASGVNGVARGSAKSIAVVEEMLFYLSPFGVMCYGGGVPSSLHDAFGGECFFFGVGGGGDGKYYISMKNKEGAPRLFVYDVTKDLWLREDDDEISDFCFWDGSLLGAFARGELKVFEGDAQGEEEGEISWFAEFGRFVQDSPDKKFVTKVLVRLEPEENAEVSLFISYDGGKYLPVGKPIRGAALRSFYLPVIPARCDHFRLRFEGTGMCRIHSLAVEYGRGSANP